MGGAGGSLPGETAAKPTIVSIRLEGRNRGGTYSCLQDARSGRSAAGAMETDTSEIAATAEIPQQSEAVAQSQWLRRWMKINYSEHSGGGEILQNCFAHDGNCDIQYSIVFMSNTPRNSDNNVI